MKGIVASFAILGISAAQAELPANVKSLFEKHCFECHDADSKKGNLDLTALKADVDDTELFARWVKVHDCIESGEMPPKKKPQPAAEDSKTVTDWLSEALFKAERARLDAERTRVRRLTRVEYENTMRDLFDLPGLSLQSGLPADGSAYGFDKNSDALDISHVNLATYMEAADRTLDVVIATQPQPPTVQKHRLSLARNTWLQITSGDAMLLSEQQPDKLYPPAGAQQHVGANEHIALATKRVKAGASVGVFRNEDESFYPIFGGWKTVYPGRYKVKASVWSFQWDKGKILPSVRGTEAARLDIVEFNPNDARQPLAKNLLGYFDAPSLKPQVHEMDVWLNHLTGFGFNTASLPPVVLYRVGNWGQKDRTMGFTGPCIASDWLEIEGPINDIWPPKGHRLLFGELPFAEIKGGEHPPALTPKHKAPRAYDLNKPDIVTGQWTIASAWPHADAERLLTNFLSKAFRRPVEEAVRSEYLALVEQRMHAGQSFESAMRAAYRRALCSPDFLYHFEPAGKLDNHALAGRLSYFLWNSMPDDELITLAASNRLGATKTLDEQVTRLMKDAKFQRFIDDFLGQWLKLRSIAATDPDKQLYPEFSRYLMESMVLETRAYFRELIEQNLNASYLVKSDFAMLNEKLATHYGIPGVSGPVIRKVKLPPGCPRGGFLTQASILKITANGTTTSPVPRGAFVMARFLGKPPEPPPPNIPAVEPDVRGTVTIRQQLDKHRADASCAACHAKMDPPGFALESFDVIGGFREKYRFLVDGKPKGGPPVDPSGELADERTFAGIADLQALLAADTHTLLKNLAQQLLVYATGRDITFSDRNAINDIVTRTEKKGGGIRDLMHEVVLSRLFQTR
jgi:mono/diheme cytochrome c family protein